MRSSPPDSAPKAEPQKPPVPESAPTKPVQSVAPQARDSSGFSVLESGQDSLVDLWDTSADPPPDRSQTSRSSQSSNLVDLMGDVGVPPGAAKPQPLLSFDDMVDGTFCAATAAAAAEDDPASLVDVMDSDQMTLSYQHALQHASGDKKELEDGQRLMTNGETLLKEGTQVGMLVGDQFEKDAFLLFPSLIVFFLRFLKASEGYFSQSQEEEFGQSEESSAKPAPVFYNKPPGEILKYYSFERIHPLSS